MTAGESAAILVVDDRAENRFAMEVVLESLDERIVLAESGGEALRRLAQQDFAVILLDVNMPWLDGFETAELIRAQRKSDPIPIIFITAYADDMHVARGYSLGAVDYILSPVVPEVLRSKVAFFVDLYRKNQQVQRQAALLGERAARQHRLADASLAIHSAPSLDRLLEVLTTTAAGLVDSRWAESVSISDLRGHVDRGCSRADAVTYAPRAIRAPQNEPASFVSLVLARNEPVRKPDAIAERRYFVDEAGYADGADATCIGRLAVPLQRADGSNMGLIQVAGASAGGFTDEDEAVLLQLGHMASIAVENVLLAREREASQLKDEFLATLSHELRTPLGAILGWTHILAAQSSTKDARLAEGLAVIERSVRAQNRLIEDLLDLSRISRGEVRLDRRVIDLGSVLQASFDAAHPTAKARNIDLQLCTNDVSPPVLADSDRLQQVFGNLLSNALKFTSPGGRVKVRLHVRDSEAEVAVVDDGDGIEESFLPLVFDRFRQADHGNTRRFTGLGIGLTIVKHLVEAHGGRIDVASPGQNRGTTVTVAIPIAPAVGVAESAQPPRSFAPSTNLAGVRILVVDDQEDARDVAARILRGAGAEVVSASSVREAFRSIDRGPPDLVISDLAMPEESGFALVARLRSLAPRSAAFRQWRSPRSLVPPTGRKRLRPAFRSMRPSRATPIACCRWPPC